MCDHEAARTRMACLPTTSEPAGGPGDERVMPVRFNHAVVGLAGEAGELASLVQKWLYYGKRFEREHALEELGDCLWYVALACTALGAEMADVMAANIDKLLTRYPAKYADELAAEEGRDRAAEAAAMKARLKTLEDQELGRRFLDVKSPGDRPDGVLPVRRVYPPDDKPGLPETDAQEGE